MLLSQCCVYALFQTNLNSKPALLCQFTLEMLMLLMLCVLLNDVTDISWLFSIK